jgi:hypothetical protein
MPVTFVHGGFTRKLRRLAIIGAACAGLTGTVLTGSASAATGGGCGTANDSIQACSTWVTGEGFGYYIHNSEPRNSQYAIKVYYCPTGSTATSSTKCGAFDPVPGQFHEVTVVNPGNHPSPPYTWTGSRVNHGIAYSIWYEYVPGLGWVPAGMSKEVYW